MANVPAHQPIDFAGTNFAGTNFDDNGHPIESYSAWTYDEHGAITRHVFVWPEKPFTVNAANASRWKWIAARAEWRDAHQLMAHGCQPLAWCNITVDHLTATRRAVDVAACLPSYKAALDGVVLAGVLPDDTPTYVRRVTFNAPIFAGRDALIITMEGPVAPDPLEATA